MGSIREWENKVRGREGRGEGETYRAQGGVDQAMDRSSGSTLNLEEGGKGGREGGREEGTGVRRDLRATRRKGGRGGGREGGRDVLEAAVGGVDLHQLLPLHHGQQTQERREGEMEGRRDYITEDQNRGGGEREGGREGWMKGRTYLRQ